MARISTGHKDLSTHEYYGEASIKAHVYVTEASDEAVQTIVTADPDSDDGRSQWVWLRFPNGDLFLAVAPQGETYFATEHDHCKG